MTPIRFGVIGCGAIHSTHCLALKKIEDVRLEAVYDTIKERSKAASGTYDAVAAKSLRDLFDRVDVVSICTPSGLHTAVGVKAAQAGKHVIVEKPIDVSLAAAKRLVDACKANGVRLGCISQHRFARQIRRLRDAAQSGEMGDLVAADAKIKWYRTQHYYDSGDWRGTWKLDGGGCLMNQGVHYIDMLQWVMGGVKSVQAMCRTLAHNIEVEDVANVLVEFKNGAVGVIQGSTSYYPGFAERLEVHGKWGSAILEGDRVRVWRVDSEKASLGKYGDGVMSQPTPNLHSYQSDDYVAEDPTAVWGEQHRLQLEDFAQAVRDDREPFLTGEMALEPLKIILAIYRSSKAGGKRVEIE